MNLAAAATDLAQTLYRLGRLPEAQNSAEYGLAIAKSLVESEPSLSNYTMEVYARVTLAQILRDREIFYLAEGHLEEAIEVCIELSGFDPENPEYHRLLGESRNNLGVVFLLTGDYDRARQSFSNAGLAFNNALALLSSPAIRDGLAWSKSYLGAAFHKLNRTKESEAAYQEALSIREQAKARCN